MIFDIGWTLAMIGIIGVKIKDKRDFEWEEPSNIALTLMAIGILGIVLMLVSLMMTAFRCLP
jgi:preprotein translocase subunit Sss1